MANRKLGVFEYLKHIEGTTKKEMTFVEYEKKYNLTGHKYPGNKGSKLWYRFLKSGLSAEEYYRERVNKDYVGEVEDLSSNEIWETDLDKGEAKFEGIVSVGGKVSEEKIKEQIDYDPEEWEPYKIKYKKYDVHMKVRKPQRIKGGDTKYMYEEEPVKKTNYYVSVDFKRKDVLGEKLMSQLLEESLAYIPKMKIKKCKGNGIGVIPLADFHLGSKVIDLVKMPDFNINILEDMLMEIADTINSMKYKEVHVSFLGDMFESISGLNHLTTFKGLEHNGWGAKIIKLGGLIFARFLSSINNLKTLYIIAGNHDRISASSKVDDRGAGAELLAEILDLRLPKVKVEFHPYVLSPIIDGICYIFTHGDKMKNKKTSDIVNVYGSKDHYTVWLSAHTHTRKSIVTWLKKVLMFEEVPVVSMDHLNYRHVVVPPLITGNYYSASNGMFGTGGYMMFKRTGKGKISMIDNMV